MIKNEEKLMKRVQKKISQALMDNGQLQYLIKWSFRGLVHAVHRQTTPYLKLYPKSIVSPEARAFYRAMTRCRDVICPGESKGGNEQIIEEIRDVIVCLVESQDFYRERFKEFTIFLDEELQQEKDKERGQDYMMWEN